MIDKDFCLSSYIAFRYIWKDGVDFAEGMEHDLIEPVPVDDRIPVATAQDIDQQIQRQFDELYQHYPNKPAYITVLFYFEFSFLFSLIFYILNLPRFYYRIQSEEPCLNFVYNFYRIKTCLILNIFFVCIDLGHLVLSSKIDFLCLLKKITYLMVLKCSNSIWLNFFGF